MEPSVSFSWALQSAATMLGWVDDNAKNERDSMPQLSMQDPRFVGHDHLECLMEQLVIAELSA